MILLFNRVCLTFTLNYPRVEKEKARVGAYKVMYRVVKAVLLRCNLNAFAV